MSRGGEGWGIRMAPGLVVGITVATAVALVGCGDSGDDDKTAVDAQVEAIADQTEAKGWLRPIFPSYVPDQMEPLPEVFYGSATNVSFVFPPGEDTGADDVPRLVDLGIDQSTDWEFNSCPSEDDDPDFTCVEIVDVQAGLQTTHHGDGTVSYDLHFRLHDRGVYVGTSWDTGGPVTDELDRFMRGETIRVAESLFGR